MSRRGFAVTGLAATVLLTTAGVLLTTTGNDWVANLIVGLLLSLFAGIAAVIILRLPDNVVGILMLSFSLATSLSLASASYGQFVYEYGHRGLPLADIAAWISLWLPLPGLGLLIFVFLRFPNGELLTPRWRAIEYLTGATLLAGALGLAFRPGGVDSVRVAEPGGFGEAMLPNPFGMESWRGFASFTEDVGQSVLAVCVAAMLVSLFLRFRRSEGARRDQMKWLVLAVAILPAVFFVAEFVGAIDPTEEDILSFLTLMTGAFMVPVAMGVSILKYRLYDIDVVINRALVYGALTAVLVAAYLGLVVSLRAILDAITPDSDLAVAASTLAVAALFRPVRTRVQAFIDRRFYRRKYDARRTLEAFSSRLRDEVDISVVGGEVVDVVRETVQPAHVTLWLRHEGVS